MKDLLKEFIAYALEDWTPGETTPKAMSTNRDNQRTMYYMAGGASLLQSTLYNAVAEGADELAWAMESYAVTPTDPETHAGNIAKYGPWYKDWPEDMVDDVVTIHYENLRGEAHIGRMVFDKQAREFGPVTWKEAKVSGSCTNFFDVPTLTSTLPTEDT